MMMLTADDVVQFRPRNPLLGMLADAKGSASLLPQLVAVASGIRPVIDDWVPVSRLDDYIEAAQDLGLVVEPNVEFEPLEDIGVLGASCLTTTQAHGSTFAKTSSQRATTHVFVARDLRSAQAAQAVGWYPLVSEGSVVPAAWSDAEQFGHQLGYPKCCIKSFIKNNRWSEVGHIQRLGSPGNASGKRNFLPRHLGFSWTFHIPCGWHCTETLEQANATRTALAQLDPEYTDFIDAISYTPVLLWSERTLYLLFGGKNKHISPLFAGGNPTDDRYSQVLASGDEVTLDGDLVVVTRGGQFEESISTPNNAPTFLEFQFP